MPSLVDDQILFLTRLRAILAAGLNLEMAGETINLNELVVGAQSLSYEQRKELIKSALRTIAEDRVIGRFGNPRK